MKDSILYGWTVLSSTIVCVLSSSFVTFSQYNPSAWTFGDSCKITFDSNGFGTSTFSHSISRGPCSTLSDSLGNVKVYSYLRYEDDSSGYVCNAQDSIINGVNKIAAAGLYMDALLLRAPGDSNKCYLFHNGRYTAKGFHCTVIENVNTQPVITVANIQLVPNQRMGDCLQAIKCGDGLNWWVVAKMGSFNLTHVNKFYVFFVDSTGIHPPIVQKFGNAIDGDLQKIHFNHAGNKLMLINISGLMTEYDFDRCSGIISNPKIIFPEQTSNYDRFFDEGAYSENDSLFYVTKIWISQPNDTSSVLQFDLFAADIPASCDTLWDIKYPVSVGAIRGAPNDKIYVTCAYDWGFPLFPYPDSVHNVYNENLSVIDSPNVKGAGCNFLPFSQYLGGKRTYWGLPNNPNYFLGRLIGSPCDTLPWASGIPNPHVSHLNAEIAVSPNPFTNEIKIELQNFKNACTLKIFDAMGKEILQQKMEQQKMEIDLSKLNSGFYNVVVCDEKNIFTKKIIKM